MLPNNGLFHSHFAVWPPSYFYARSFIVLVSCVRPIWDLIVDTVKYSSLYLVAGVAVKILGLSGAPALFAFAASSSMAMATMRIFRHYHIFRFETFFYECYTFAERYSTIRTAAEVACFALGFFLPIVGMLAAIPLGLLHGLVVEMKIYLVSDG